MRAGAASLGLRGRTITIFGAMALVLCGITATAVWIAVTSYLLGQRQDAATTQAIGHVEQLAPILGEPARTPPEQLASLARTIGSVSLLALPGPDGANAWYASSLEVSRDTIPATLRERVADGQPARQRVEVGGSPALIVGVPLPGAAGAYFEVFPLDELRRTYRALSVVLVAGTISIPLATVALGGWALRPALRPLDTVADVARAVAAGDLSARLDPGRDAALVPIAASFNQTAAALERRVKVDAQFAADVSHELRSPLTAMMGAVSAIAQHQSSLPESGAEMLALLESEINRFARLVEDLLEISRLEAGSADLALEPIRLSDLVSHAVPPHLADRVETTGPGRDVVVSVDKRRMERALANLIDNGEQHGRGVTRVLVDADDRAGVVTVEDRGPGLADEELDRIFDRFARSRRTGRASTSGAGLGLSLVARHLQLMEGHVRAESRSGGGARFVVTVPAAVTRGDPG